jgi:hypothetical protein
MVDALAEEAKSSRFDPMDPGRVNKLEIARRMAWGLQMAARAKLNKGELTKDEKRGISIAVCLAKYFGEEFVARHVAAFMAQFRGGPVDTEPVFAAVRAVREGESEGD